MASHESWKDGPSADRSPEERELAGLFASLREREEGLPALEEARRACEERLARESRTGRLLRLRQNLQKGWWEMWRPANWSLARLGMAVAMLLLVLACTVPLDYDREAGLDLKVTVNGNLQPVLELVKANWDLEALNVNEDGAGGVIQARLRDARPEDLEKLRGMAGVTSVESEAWSEESHGSLFTMMMDNIFHARLDISGMNDEQINQALNEQLRQQGYPGSVTVTRVDGELPQVQVQVEADGDSTAHRPLQIELSDRRGGLAEEGAWELVGGGCNLELGDLHGLSEAQIRTRVAERLRAQGINPDSARIEVTSQGDSSGHALNRQVRVAVANCGPR